jgi:hypothetical protein
MIRDSDVKRRASVTHLSCWLASSTYHCTIWGISDSQFSFSQGWGQHRGLTNAVQSYQLHQPHHHKFAPGKVFFAIKESFIDLEDCPSVLKSYRVGTSQHIQVGLTPSSSSLNWDCPSCTSKASFTLPLPGQSSTPRSSQSWVLLTRRVCKCVGWDDPAPIAFTPFPLSCLPA